MRKKKKRRKKGKKDDKKSDYCAKYRNHCNIGNIVQLCINYGKKGREDKIKWE